MHAINDFETHIQICETFIMCENEKKGNCSIMQLCFKKSLGT